MNKGIMRKLYFGFAASGLVYAMGGSSVALGFPRAAPGDFNGDGTTDLKVIHPSQSIDQLTWSSLGPFGAPSDVPFGLTTDIVVPGDYDGDFRTDHAIYRRTFPAQWWILDINTGTNKPVVSFGIGTDTPVPADYDGDGKTDLSVVRVNESGPGGITWFVKLSTTGQSCTIPWGLSTDIPVPADYDGDGISELAIFRPDTGFWWILGQDCVSAHVPPNTVRKFGLAGDEPVPGYYDNDDKVDLAVFRPATGTNGTPTNGTWFVLKSSNNQVQTFVLGLPSDRRVPGDYNGDGKWDFAVYRPSTSKWIIRYNGSSTNVESTFGQRTDLPVPSAYTFREPLPRRTGF